MDIEERDLSVAREHPRGTERRTLLRFREALNDPLAYARLPVGARDMIVRWVEIRRRLKENEGVDRSQDNLADPLLPFSELLAAVIAGETQAGGVAPADEAGDVREVVRRMRGP